MEMPKAEANVSELHERLRTLLRSREPRYLELLRHMVAINSFTENPAGVAALALLTAEAFAGLGFASETVAAENPSFGPHLVLTRRARRGEAPPRIGLVSHLDTVFPPEEEQKNGFGWREVGDRIYGPGTVDIKGGTVVIYMVLDALAAEAPEVFDAVDWVVLLNAAEEQLALDFGRLARERLAGERLAGGRTLGCLVFEGGYLRGTEAPLVVARKGMAVYRVAVEGRASHAGSAHARGANAVVQLADVIRRIADWTDPARDLTFNVGTVEGGTVVNRVPHHAEAGVEMRCFLPDVFAEGMRRMLSLAEHVSVRSVEDGFPCTVRVEVTEDNPPWSRNPGSERLLEVWKEAAAPLGLTVVPEERGGLSDGNQLWRDFPTLDGLGPSGANAHCSEHRADGTKEQEYATRSSFVPKALLTAMALLRLVGSRLQDP
jgi:glutamate carboxypeptidase